jgi:hypothetical protein
MLLLLVHVARLQIVGIGVGGVGVHLHSLFQRTRNNPLQRQTLPVRCGHTQMQQSACSINHILFL